MLRCFWQMWPLLVSFYIMLFGLETVNIMCVCWYKPPHKFTFDLHIRSFTGQFWWTMPRCLWQHWPLMLIYLTVCITRQPSLHQEFNAQFSLLYSFSHMEDDAVFYNTDRTGGYYVLNQTLSIKKLLHMRRRLSTISRLLGENGVYLTVELDS